MPSASFLARVFAAGAVTGVIAYTARVLWQKRTTRTTRTTPQNPAAERLTRYGERRRDAQHPHRRIFG